MGRLSRTKYILRNTPERVVITRHEHPLKDQEFEVLMGGNERIVIRLEDGTSMRIPRDLIQLGDLALKVLHPYPAVHGDVADQVLTP